MTLTGLAEALRRAAAKSGDHQTRIWKLIAFVGRYACQPANVSLHMPVDDLQRLADATSQLLDDEVKNAQRSTP